jgi:hypothetical protein
MTNISLVGIGILASSLRSYGLGCPISHFALDHSGLVNESQTLAFLDVR